VSTAKLSQKNQIVIPKDARQKMKVSAGDTLIVHTINGITLLYPKPDRIASALQSLATGAYQNSYLKKERDAW